MAKNKGKSLGGELPTRIKNLCHAISEAWTGANLPGETAIRKGREMTWKLVNTLLAAGDYSIRTVQETAGKVGFGLQRVFTTVNLGRAAADADHAKAIGETNTVQAFLLDPANPMTVVAERIKVAQARLREWKVIPNPTRTEKTDAALQRNILLALIAAIDKAEGIYSDSKGRLVRYHRSGRLVPAFNARVAVVAILTDANTVENVPLGGPYPDRDEAYAKASKAEKRTRTADERKHAQQESNKRSRTKRKGAAEATAPEMPKTASDAEPLAENVA